MLGVVENPYVDEDKAGAIVGQAAFREAFTDARVRERLKVEVDALRGEIAALMTAAVQAGTEVLAAPFSEIGRAHV